MKVTKEKAKTGENDNHFHNKSSQKVHRFKTTYLSFFPALTLAKPE